MILYICCRYMPSGLLRMCAPFPVRGATRSLMTTLLVKRSSLHGIKYLQMKTLGGLRHARADSLNTGWENASFQGFADYMQTPEFAAAVQQLIEAAIEKPAAIMCAEAVPWRCHRSLIADALTVRGITVQHILSRTSARVHTVTPMARVEGTALPIRESRSCCKRMWSHAPCSMTLDYADS